ncbi:hypothetical protein OG422_02945 [Streptomyces sp. NBC_01525]|uniref:hypothetical protein n=1 Tax=Streptomyces sp. NBC_01525 TaxID=2903893 RepID=UPI003863AF8E
MNDDEVTLELGMGGSAIKPALVERSGAVTAGGALPSNSGDGAGTVLRSVSGRATRATGKAASAGRTVRAFSHDMRAGDLAEAPLAGIPPLDPGAVDLGSGPPARKLLDDASWRRS